MPKNKRTLIDLTGDDDNSSNSHRENPAKILRSADSGFCGSNIRSSNAIKDEHDTDKEDDDNYAENEDHDERREGGPEADRSYPVNYVKNAASVNSSFCDLTVLTSEPTEDRRASGDDFLYNSWRPRLPWNTKTGWGSRQVESKSRTHSSKSSSPVISQSQAKSGSRCSTVAPSARPSSSSRGLTAAPTPRPSSTFRSSTAVPSRRLGANCTPSSSPAYSQPFAVVIPPPGFDYSQATPSARPSASLGTSQETPKNRVSSSFGEPQATPSIRPSSSSQDSHTAPGLTDRKLPGDIVDGSDRHDDDDDADELVATTQDNVDQNGTANSQHYGTLLTKIVGIRYYNGYATIGEHVVCRREPTNGYDANAIRVDNVQSAQIGHIPRGVAKKLAPYLDAGELTMVAILSGQRNDFDCPLRVDLYGTSDPVAREALIRRMVRDKLPVESLGKKEREEKAKRAAELKRLTSRGQNRPSEDAGTTSLSVPAEDQSLENLIAGSEHFNPREVAEAVEKFGAGEDVLAKMPTAEQPVRIETRLLPYQKQGLAWLLEKENLQLPPEDSTEVVQMWKRSPSNQRIFTNIATNFSLKDAKPKLASGAILADDMGLGKTLMVISVIVEDLEWYQPQAGEAATLIVAPLSVMSNWSGQVKEHVDPERPLRVLVYHGSGKKTMTAKGFSDYDIVITTYGMLAAEYMPTAKGKTTPAPVPRPTGLFSVEWRRIVLDEAHTIRNPSTKGSLAATAIQARSRLALTGTPLVNSLKDLYSLVRFIGLSGGLEKFEVFNNVLIRPATSRDGEATLLLQALMSTLCLRRRKDMAFMDLKLPELKEYVHRIELSSSEKEKYDALEAEAKGLLRQYQSQTGRRDAAHGAQQTYRHLLEILLRMRQVCNHWKLCGERISALMKLLEQQKTVDLRPENCRALQEMLRISIEAREDCPVCLEDLHDPVITHCAHAFGKDCILRVIETQHRCPLCRAPIRDDKKLVKPAAGLGENVEGEAANGNLDKVPSSKVTALLSILAAAHRKPGTKLVVFSQWARFLDLLEPHLTDCDYTYARIDGSMSVTARDVSLRALEHDPKTTILLATLGVCSVGLNLTAASQLLLCDSWWAPAVEDQAVDRVHRLGQTRACTVWRLVVEGSVEERTLAVQAEKRRLMMTAFQEKSGKRTGGRSARLGDIERLLA